MLESARIRFSPVERVHMKAYLQWLNSPLLAPLWEDRAPRPHTARSAEAWLESIHDEMARGWHHYVIHVKADGAVVGLASLVDLSERDRHARIRVAVAAPKQRKAGVEGEAAALLAHLAFTELNLNRVQMTTWEFTEETTLRILDETGFRQEGHLRERLFWRGRFWEATLWGLLRSDWARDHPDLLPFGADGHGPGDEKAIAILPEAGEAQPREDGDEIFFTTDLMVRDDDDEY